MAVSYRSFLIELYEEHLEEASFLYDQRLSIFHNPAITWKKIGEFEERLQAHLDGLVVGGELAIDVCRAHAEENDSGQLYVALCVICRQNREKLLLAALEQLDLQNESVASAVVDALKYELPDAWIPDFLVFLTGSKFEFTSILARALGYRRVRCGPQLVDTIGRCPASVLPQLIWALGRIGYLPARDLLFEYLISEEDRVRQASAVALARLGDKRVLDYCLDNVRSHVWTILVLGLAGGRDAIPILTEFAENRGCEESLYALGLLGDPSTIPVLVSRLTDPASSAAASNALLWMTGAGLSETAFLPDKMDEDEAVGSESVDSRPPDGRPILTQDKPAGRSVVRASQNIEDWRYWLDEHGRHFTTGRRYRKGRPIGPRQLVDSMIDEGSPHLLRQSCSDELAIRYGYDFGFEGDLPVQCQTVLLSAASVWSDTAGAGFREGAWYFSGSMVSPESAQR